MRAGHQLLHHCLRESGPKHLSWPLPAKLGFFLVEEFPTDGALRAPLHHRLLQHLESRQFRESGVDGYWGWLRFRKDLFDDRNAAADPVLAAFGVLTGSLATNGNGARGFASRFASAGCNFLQSDIIFRLWLKSHRVLLN